MALWKLKDWVSFRKKTHSAKLTEKLGANVFKSPGRALEMGEEIGSAAVPKNQKLLYVLSLTKQSFVTIQTFSLE